MCWEVELFMANRPIDDPYHRINANDSYKNQVFDGKKTTVDAYTGKKIYYGNAADAKRMHSIDRTADVDHITPIAKVRDRYGDLSIEQQRKIANNPNYNYAMTNSELNRHGKNALENHEYLAKELGKNIDKVKNGNYEDALEGFKDVANKTPRMLSAETKSRVGMAVEGNGYRIKNEVENVHKKVQDIGQKQYDFNNYIANQTSSFLNEDMARINVAGVNQALSAAQFAAAMSITKNTMSLIKGDEEFGDAAKSVLKDTATAAVMGYATGTIAEFTGIGVGDAALLVNGTIQISKQIYAYVNGDIDESQLLQNVAETSVYLTSAYIGKCIGGAIGSTVGPIGVLVGQFVGEMITTAVCSTVIDTIHKEQEANEHNKKMLALAHHAEKEIRESQGRLIILVNQENGRFIDALNSGYDSFIDGVLNNNYEEAAKGLASIGEEFGIEAEKLTQGNITQGNIFGKKNRVVNLG